MLERQLRLYSGLIIAVYIGLHLINHSLGLASVEAMDALRTVIAPLWQNPVGTIALYGSLLLHFLLALRSVYRRDTLRMPLWEAAQLTLGLLIVPMLIAHVVGTRLTRSLLDFDTTYHYVVTILWNDDWYRIKQPLLVLIVWGHATVGLHFWLRLKAWYTKSLPYVYAFAILLPVLRCSGLFVPANRLVSSTPLRKCWSRYSGPGAMPVLNSASLSTLWLTGDSGYLPGYWSPHCWPGNCVDLSEHAIPSGYTIHQAGCLLPRSGKPCWIRYVRQGSRMLRCAAAGHAVRPAVFASAKVGRHWTNRRRLEFAALQRIGAEPNVRLACQTRPQHDLSITPLLPANATIRHAYQPGGVQGREQQVAALFIDLRGSTSLGEEKLPYDVVFILNQFFAEMSGALQITGGHYAQFTGDGLMALYGLESGFESSCREALEGAVEMARRMMHSTKGWKRSCANRYVLVLGCTPVKPLSEPWALRAHQTTPRSATT